ncbi:MAG: triose-phosphate isomerase [Syntrophomonadaceae bacterium]
MRKRTVVANWKMNKNQHDIEIFAAHLFPLLDRVKNVEIVICPSFIGLPVLSKLCTGSAVKIGAQNLFWETKGAYTGEVSPEMLVDVGCEYVIIGHSERRQIMGETDTIINRKMHAALAAGLIPILCVGETLQERENNLALQVVKGQLDHDLKDLVLLDILPIIAYEPVWAIGTGINATSDDAQNMCCFIREMLEKRFGRSTAQQVKILYGGSVNGKNIKEFLDEKDINGALVGGASLMPESFFEILEVAQNE